MPCFEQTNPVFGGVAEFAEAREIVRKKESPTTLFFMDERLNHDRIIGNGSQVAATRSI